MTILTIVIIFLFLITLAVSFGLAKKLSSPKYQKLIELIDLSY